MFKRIRIVGMIMLTLVVVLTIAVTPALADSAPLSQHTVAAHTRYYYYTGSWCFQGNHSTINMIQNLSPAVQYGSGYITSTGGGGYVQTGTAGLYGWDAPVAPNSYLRFFAENQGGTSTTSISGTIAWALY